LNYARRAYTFPPCQNPKEDRRKLMSIDLSSVQMFFTSLLGLERADFAEQTSPPRTARELSAGTQIALPHIGECSEIPDLNSQKSNALSNGHVTNDIAKALRQKCVPKNENVIESDITHTGESIIKVAITQTDQPEGSALCAALTSTTGMDARIFVASRATKRKPACVDMPAQNI
jgi:hypothetical protein